ncbi:multidrug ABC transporter permease [Thioclava sp. SK-1]|uniref:ABC transporter permease n=1 Tax=Thioclava sp. SK-1 TaxID=1889770 RepID=UPI0008267817|nr:ABC transporter permease [Thioclava sp. SK-1]OCX62262.1 multidrug ABC transporter permease [Thioclava sp. SK-1]
MRRAIIAASAIAQREVARFLNQRARFFAALVRPLVWLLIFAAGFRAALGLSIIAPYQTYITYETYIIPGLCGMILLFSGMQSSLSLIHDRESGTMRLMLTAPWPRWFTLGAKLMASSFVGLLQVAVFLAIAACFGIQMNIMGYIYVIPALFLSALMLGALGLVLSAKVRQLENFAGVMNFVIFPMFFCSSALYPIWKMKESSAFLARLCEVNPFTHSVELIRFALYQQMNWPALGWTTAATIVFFVIATVGYEPARSKR